MRQQAWPEKSNPSNRLWHGGLLWAVSQLGVGRLQDVVQDRSRSGRNVCRYCLPTCRGKQVRTGLFTTGQSTVGIKILDYSHRLNTGLDGHIQVVDLCPVVKWSVFKWWSENGTEKAWLWSQMSCIWMVHQVTWLYRLNTRHPYCLVFR